jgi:hypothetical protein
MGDAESKNRWGCVLLIILAFAGVWLWQSQADNQIVRPFPGGQPAPVVPQLPNLAADLSSSKSICESRATQVKSMSGGRGLSRELAQGQRLYGNAKAELDGCIDFLCTGLDRRFTPDDPANLAERMKKASQQVTAFVGWADAVIDRRVMGATAEPLSEGLDLLKAFMEGVGKENAEAIARIKADLEKCRLREWRELR